MNIANLVAIIASFSWMLVIGIIALAVLRASRGEPLKSAPILVTSTIVLALLLNVISAGLVFVQPQERGVVITVGGGGVRDDALQPGLRWVIPYAENVVPYSISRQTYTMSSLSTEGAIVGDDSVQARTSDGQIIFVDASVIFAVDPTKVVDLHVGWQNTYVDGLIRPQARGIIRDEVSAFGVEEVYSTQRGTLTNRVSENLAEVLAQEGFILIDFVLRNISFSEEYAASVEQKQIAEQQAQQAFFVVEQRSQEAEQARQIAKGQADAVAIKAQGDAEAVLIAASAAAEARLVQATAEAQALELLSDAVENNPDVLTLEYIQKLGPNINVMLLPSDNPFLFPLPELGAPASEGTAPVTALPAAPATESTEGESSTP